MAGFAKRFWATANRHPRLSSAAYVILLIVVLGSAFMAIPIYHRMQAEREAVIERCQEIALRAGKSAERCGFTDWQQRQMRREAERAERAERVERLAREMAEQ